MKKRVLIILGILAIIGIISLVSSAGIKDNTYDLKISCDNVDCSLVNVTVSYPNSSIFINNDPMTNNNYYANYTFNAEVLGEYIYFYSDGTNTSQGTFKITSNGYELDTAQSILYGFMGFTIILLLILSLYGSLVIPYKNKRNNNGEIFEINWSKYFKIFCIGMTYFFTMALIWVIWNLTYAYADWYAVSNVFHFLFRLMFIVFIPTILFFIVLSFKNFLDDKKINNFFKRTGLPYNG